MKTPWRYEVSRLNSMAILYDNQQTILGVVDNEDVAKLIVHAVNTVPQLHINQIIKE